MIHCGSEAVVCLPSLRVHDTCPPVVRLEAEAQPLLGGRREKLIDRTVSLEVGSLALLAGGDRVSVLLVVAFCHCQGCWGRRLGWRVSGQRPSVVHA